MAAEFSREQSTRVHRATCRVAALGYFTGGWSGYGLRRMLLGADGRPDRLLGLHEYKAVRAEHMTLVPGPPHEVRTVRRIFQLFNEKRMSPQEIADLLNGEGKRNSHGRPWRCESIRVVLRNERYLGTHTYNIKSRKLKKGPYRLNHPADQIRVPNAFEAILSPEVFAKAQEIIGKRTHKKHTEESLLARLGYLLATHGELSAAIIRADGHPDVVVYQRKIGGLRKAYAKIGYKQPRDIADLARLETVKRITNAVTDELMDLMKSKGATVSRSWPDGCIIVNDELTVAVKAMPYAAEKKRLGWRLYITRKEQPNVTVVIRMEPNNEAPRDFFLLPRRMTRRCRFRFGERVYRRFERLRYDTLDKLSAVLASRAVCS
jgi:Recombinase